MESLSHTLRSLGDSMTRRRFCAGAVALPVALTAPAADAAIDFNAAIEWRNASDGMSEAKWLSKPVFMVIHADWCPACRTYSKLFQNRAVVAKLGAFVPVLVDFDSGRTERSYRPAAYPVDSGGARCSVCATGLSGRWDTYRWPRRAHCLHSRGSFLTKRAA